VLDPPSPDVLKRPPRPPAAAMLNAGAWARIAGLGALEASLVLAVFAFWTPKAEARSMAFMVIVFAQVLRALGARSHSRTFWQVGAGSKGSFKNKISHRIRRDHLASRSKPTDRRWPNPKRDPRFFPSQTDRSTETSRSTPRRVSVAAVPFAEVGVSIAHARFTA